MAPYDGEHLWLEREIEGVANITHFDIVECLPLSAEALLEVEVETYALALANRAVVDLKRNPVHGAKVLVM